MEKRVMEIDAYFISAASELGIKAFYLFVDVEDKKHWNPTVSTIPSHLQICSTLRNIT